MFQTLRRWWGPVNLTKKGAGIHHLYATSLVGRRLSPALAINVVTPPSHWITDLNVRVDAAARRGNHHRLTSHGSSAAPSPLSLGWPTGTGASCPPQRWATGCKIKPPFRRKSEVRYEALWGANYLLACRLPLDRLYNDQRRHISAHRLDNIPTMTVLALGSSHCNTVLDTKCLACGTEPKNGAPPLGLLGLVPRLGASSLASPRVARPESRRRAVLVRNQPWEPCVLEHWAAASHTPSMPCVGPTWSALDPTRSRLNS